MSTPTHGQSTDPEIPLRLQLVFAPLHKRALGMAFGLVTGPLVFLATVAGLRLPPGSHFPLDLLNNYFYGYSVTWEGAFVGLFWGGVVGFVFGWFFAFCRNFVIASWLFFVRTRAELANTRDFLDHI